MDNFDYDEIDLSSDNESPLETTFLTSDPADVRNDRVNDNDKDTNNNRNSVYNIEKWRPGRTKTLSSILSESDFYQNIQIVR